ncbi:MAG TPA: roadblock/LC7 domain-containing protein, partial [Longimicrobiales bacterium]|nr:roadblock/LC7 domain-containing protein [Longimicrobiales bacterium]
ETTFASLAAADFAASDQLAGLLGEDEFTSLYHQGEAGSMYLADVAGSAILAAVFDHSTTLGMVRLKTRTVVPEVVELLNELVGRPSQPGQGLDASWLSAAADEIDRLFAG